jgi:hypothetical protein
MREYQRGRTHGGTWDTQDTRVWLGIVLCVLFCAIGRVGWEGGVDIISMYKISKSDEHAYQNSRLCVVLVSLGMLVTDKRICLGLGTVLG